MRHSGIQIFNHLIPRYLPPKTKNKIDTTWGASEGSKYIDATHKLRIILKNNPKIKNYAELDAIE